MSMGTSAGRLSLLQAAFVIARRDFTAILFSRAFIFFLLGPLFPLGVAALAGGIGAQIQSEAQAADVGIAMLAEDTDAFMQARDELAAQVGPAIPPVLVLERLEPGASFDAEEVLESGEGRIAAVVTGTLAEPELTAPQSNLARWSGTIALIAATAQSSEATAYPQVVTHPVATSGASQNRGRYQTAQGGQILLFLLIMLLASMVLSNLVEEKGNKIIEILAAAVPMNAVFMGKLFAMLGISIFGIMVWGSIGSLLMMLGETSLSDFANPGVGWPMFFLLGAIYFAMGYLLLGSIFLTIGSMAPTVRDVQTMAMPVTMAQVVVFFLANMAVTRMGTWIEYVAIMFPLSSPFVMVARGAMDEALWPHLLAIAWQILCVVIFVRVGSTLFRRKVMKSGPQASKARALGLFRIGSKSTG
jgi:ABC-2 type transport system permease protein